MGILFNKRNPEWLNHTCVGIIEKCRMSGMNSPTVLTVRYCVNGIEYKLKETVKLKSEFIKFGSIPIGQRKESVLPNVNPGTELIVCYNPKKPKQAYLRDNIGHITN